MGRKALKEFEFTLPDSHLLSISLSCVPVGTPQVVDTDPRARPAFLVIRRNMRAPYHSYSTGMSPRVKPRRMRIHGLRTLDLSLS